MRKSWYYCLLTAEGVALTADREVALAKDKNPQDIANLYHLPSSQRSGLVDQPPLRVQLPDDAVECALERSHNAFAFTEYGPGPRDKVVNQDAALAAAIPTPLGKFLFAAVADGVSTHTLWPERASRVACLCSFLKAFQWVRYEGRRFSSREEVQAFRDALADLLRTTLEEDRSLLEQSRTVSPFWDPALYDRLRSELRLWYNTTLLVACFGPGGGIIVHIGDGGMGLCRVREGNPPERRELLVTDEGTTLDRALGLDLQATDLKASNVSLGQRDTAEIYLASDGIDRTLQRIGDAQANYESLLKAAFDETSSTNLETILAELARRKQAEQDNWSIAGIRLLKSGEECIEQDSRQIADFGRGWVPPPGLAEAFGALWKHQPELDAERPTAVGGVPGEGEEKGVLTDEQRESLALSAAKAPVDADVTPEESGSATPRSHTMARLLLITIVSFTAGIVAGYILRGMAPLPVVAALGLAQGRAPVAGPAEGAAQHRRAAPDPETSVLHAAEECQ